jgi:hypothetical protein
VTAGDRPCAGHDTIKNILGDHEDRLREKRDRIIALEMEVKHMKEGLDLIVVQNKEIKAGLDSLASTKTYIMGGLALLGVIYGLAVAHGPTILRLLGGGA